MITNTGTWALLDYHIFESLPVGRAGILMAVGFSMVWATDPYLDSSVPFNAGIVDAAVIEEDEEEEDGDIGDMNISTELENNNSEHDGGAGYEEHASRQRSRIRSRSSYSRARPEKSGLLHMYGLWPEKGKVMGSWRHVVDKGEPIRFQYQPLTPRMHQSMRSFAPSPQHHHLPTASGTLFRSNRRVSARLRRYERQIMSGPLVGGTSRPLEPEIGWNLRQPRTGNHRRRVSGGGSGGSGGSGTCGGTWGGGGIGGSGGSGAPTPVHGEVGVPALGLSGQIAPRLVLIDAKKDGRK
jgi:uncharacterized membrane protein YgcG